MCYKKIEREKREACLGTRGRRSGVEDVEMLHLINGFNERGERDAANSNLA